MSLVAHRADCAAVAGTRVLSWPRRIDSLISAGVALSKRWTLDCAPDSLPVRVCCATLGVVTETSQGGPVACPRPVSLDHL